MTQARRAPLTARPAAARSSRRRASIGSEAQDFDAEAFAQLYSKLAATLSASQTVGSASDSLLSVLIPGQYLEQNLDPKSAATQYLLSNVLNPTLECSWVARKNAAMVPDVYEAIINGKETPLVELSPEQKAQLDRAVRLLYQADGAPTPYYADYLADSADYLNALDGYEQAQASYANGGPPVPPEIIAALEAADARWRDHGHQADVDRALATIADLEAFDPATYWRKLALRYRDSTRAFDDSRYQHTTSNPPYPRWFDDEGWTSFYFDEQDFLNQDRSGSVGTGDGCRCPDGIRPSTYGGFHGAATDFASDGLRLSGSAPSRFSFTASIRRVEIMRPWLDPVVLHSRAWRWSPASGSYGIVVCSGGNLAGAVVPTGVMPVLPVTAVLAKDVEIDWSDDGELAAAMTRRQGLRHELRFGCFRLTRAEQVDGHISMRDPQLIGYLSELLPRSPDPDLRLPWP